MSLWLNLFARFTACSTLFLLFAGGMVTSMGAGLSVPDWPLSYGMFFPPMVGNIFYEHGHRMVAGFVGICMIALCLWLWVQERRRWVKWVGAAALGTVIAQAVLGGITVLFLLPAPVSVGHAALAEIFFCLTVSLALFTSREWIEEPPLALEHRGNASFVALSVLTVVVIFFQILLGALMRHTGSGLAIPDFPLSFGRLIPPQWTPPIAINFAHRVGAVVAFIFIVWVGTKAMRQYRGQPKMVRPAIGLKALLLIQIILGGATVWTQKAPMVTTFHLTVGAMILAASVILMLRAFHHLVARKRLKI